MPNQKYLIKLNWQWRHSIMISKTKERNVKVKKLMILWGKIQTRHKMSHYITEENEKNLQLSHCMSLSSVIVLLLQTDSLSLCFMWITEALRWKCDCEWCCIQSKHSWNGFHNSFTHLQHIQQEKNVVQDWIFSRVWRLSTFVFQI